MRLKLVLIARDGKRYLAIADEHGETLPGQIACDVRTGIASGLIEVDLTLRLRPEDLIIDLPAPLGPGFAPPKESP